jgi:hypothetical protein
MKKIYMSYISHKYVFKNQAHQEIFQMLVELDRQIFKELDHFQNTVTLAIEFINLRNPRSNRIEAYWDRGLDINDDWHLRIPGICRFSIYEIKGNWDENG